MKEECFDREEMLTEIQANGLTMFDLALYLDTHPEDKRAICMHREYSKKLRELTDKYQRVFGPLTINYPCNKWRWIEEPWPWERGNF